MQVIVRGSNLSYLLDDLRAFAAVHGLEILSVEPLDGPKGRPRAQVDFVRICDSLRGRVQERGAIRTIAQEYGVSPAWIYKWVIPVIRSRPPGLL
ncbi:MAG: hypothetical protein V3T78_06380 [Dehalococcoidia bacterium]